jgi:hypothetical protein
MEEFQLPHFEHCKPRLQHVMVWSSDQELFTRSIDFIKLEFENNIYPITIDDIPTVTEKVTAEEIEHEIEKYDFHVIKVHHGKVELLLKDNQRHIVEEVEEIEDAIELMGQKIIKWYWDNQY